MQCGGGCLHVTNISHISNHVTGIVKAVLYVNFNCLVWLISMNCIEIVLQEPPTSYPIRLPTKSLVNQSMPNVAIGPLPLPAVSDIALKMDDSVSC